MTPALLPWSICHSASFRKSFSFLLQNWRADMHEERQAGQAQSRQVGQVHEIQAGHTRGETGWTGTE
jgi:hypothetical protein